MIFRPVDDAATDSIWGLADTASSPSEAAPLQKDFQVFWIKELLMSWCV